MVLDSSDPLCLPCSLHQSFHCRPRSKTAFLQFLPWFYITLYNISIVNLCVDGEYGALFGGVKCDALRYDDNVQSIYGSCFCNLRSKICSSQNSHLDQHSQASHWLFRDSAHVKKFFKFLHLDLYLWLDIDSFI